MPKIRQGGPKEKMAPKINKAGSNEPAKTGYMKGKCTDIDYTSLKEENARCQKEENVRSRCCSFPLREGNLYFN